MSDRLRWHRWITPKAECRQSSIHGLGVFATQRIPAREIVVVFGGAIVPKCNIEQYREEVGHLGLQISDDFFICPHSREEVEDTGTFNHSCESNCGCLDSIQIIAIRDIEAGEELTFDEAFTETYFSPISCNCGSPHCRGIIRPTDWQDPELQRRYGPYFSPYIRAKFED